MTDTNNDAAFEQDEKEIEYQHVCENIESDFDEQEELSLRLIDLQQQISAERMRNIELQARSSVHLSSIKNEQNKTKFVINEEHEKILNGKRDEIKIINEQKNNQETSKNLYEEGVIYSIEGIKEKTRENIEIKKEFHRIQNEIEETKLQIGITQNKVSEQNIFLQSLKQTKLEGESAIKKLEKRAMELDTARGGRLDCIKQISCLQSEIGELNEKITNIKTHNEKMQTETEEAKQKYEMDSNAIKQSVNWEREKQELKEELKSIKNKIAQQKSKINTQEKKATSDTNKVRKYNAFVKKWAKKLEAQKVPEKTISQLWDEYKEAKNETENTNKNMKTEFETLVEKNLKLEDVINSRNNKVQSLMKQFRFHENQFKSNSGKCQEDFEQKEQNLLQEITKIRLRIAEKEENE